LLEIAHPSITTSRMPVASMPAAQFGAITRTPSIPQDELMMLPTRPVDLTTATTLHMIEATPTHPALVFWGQQEITPAPSQPSKYPLIPYDFDHWEQEFMVSARTRPRSQFPLFRTFPPQKRHTEEANPPPPVHRLIRKTHLSQVETEAHKQGEVSQEHA